MLKEELSRFGTVKSFLRFMMESELRIFVEFGNAQEALQVYINLNKLYFYESQVSVRFYDEANYRQYQLNDPLHEHIIF